MSDDGAFALSVIGFVGSVFSPYYAWARARRPTPADAHCALNVALYGRGVRRWTMTERAARHVTREPDRFRIGPSSMHWDGTRLRVEIDERAVPTGRRVRGTLTVEPRHLSRFATRLDAAGDHRWGPIAPSARIVVRMSRPEVEWEGEAYVDSNCGAAPIDDAFVDWDWSRAKLPDGSIAVLYEVRAPSGPDRLLALRFMPDGRVSPFDAPPRDLLPRTRWRIERRTRSDTGAPARVLDTFEDTPFYARSLVESSLLGERVTSIHETLDVGRFRSTAVRLMLPWRMPRRR